jgi:hypothetical protein
MSDGLGVQPVIRAEAAICRAASKCCGAKLDVERPGINDPRWSCQTCGQPCERVILETEKVIFNG